MPDGLQSQKPVTKRRTLLESHLLMTIEQVREIYNAQPFKPFVIHLADGRQISVPSRESIMVSPIGRTMVVYRPDGVAHIIDLPLVTDLEVLPAANGSRRRRKR